MQFSGGEPHFDAILSHLGEEVKPYGAVTPPIFQNSLFVFEKTADLLEALSGVRNGPPHLYSRVSNPTIEIAETKIAALEGMAACKVMGGGIGAISSALASELQSGGHVVIVETAYGPARAYLRYLAKFGVSHSLVEGGDTEEILDAVRPETKVIYLESPSSMVFRMQDVPAVTAFARERGITTMFDNTYSTPLHMRPAEFGIDVVIHSASKYLGGHSDINAGAICADTERISKITANEINFNANLIHPFSAWLLIRGLRTLKVRLKQHELAANQVAGWLERQTQVDRVHHVSLPSYPQRDLYLELMTGSGGIFSFEPRKQDRDSILAFCDALQIFQRGISWGGFESLVVPAYTRALDGRNRWFIRLFCGLEDPEELRADIESALIHLND